MTTNRRSVLAALCALALPGLAVAQGAPRMRVHKDPNCGCCTGWAKHVREAGFTVDIIETADLAGIKARLGVPEALASCHTAEIAGYLVEGHVPPAEIRRLLAERPNAFGLAVPDMPVGSPGMEVPGAAPETYDVVLFGPAEQSTFARYRGAMRL